jgi:hypothetical protein
LANKMNGGSHLARRLQGGGAPTILTLSLLLTASVSRGEESSIQQFDIAAQSLSSALNEFARQSQQQILFAPDIVAQKLSVPIRGEMQSLSALKLLLKNSGLTFTSTPNGNSCLRSPCAAKSVGQRRRIRSIASHCGK